MDKQEIYSVTMLRGLACLGVCITHFSGTIASESLHQITQYGAYGVPLFFVISGFILPYSLEKSAYQIRNYFRFMLKRIIRLEPAYLLSILGIFTLSVLAQFSKFSSSQPIEIFTRNNLLHLFYLVNIFDGKWLNPVYWTLAIEFQFYLLVGLLLPSLKTRNIFVLSCVFIVLTLLSIFLNNDTYVPYYFIMFLPGIVLYWYSSKRINLKLFLFFLAVTGISGFYRYGISGPICELLAIGFILFATKPIKPLLFLGNISYSLYLIHTIVGTDGLINYLQNYITDSLGRILLTLITFPIVVLIAWVFYLLIERPTLKLSKKISY